MCHIPEDSKQKLQESLQSDAPLDICGLKEYERFLQVLLLLSIFWK